MPRATLILVAHGSRAPRWRTSFDGLLSRLQRQLGAQRVLLAFLDYCPPTVPDVLASALAHGTNKLIVLPLFMSGGSHVENDIPQQVQQALAQQSAAVEVEFLPPVGEHPEFVQWLASFAASTLKEGAQ